MRAFPLIVCVVVVVLSLALEAHSRPSSSSTSVKRVNDNRADRSFTHKKAGKHTVVIANKNHVVVSCTKAGQTDCDKPVPEAAQVTQEVAQEKLDSQRQQAQEKQTQANKQKCKLGSTYCDGAGCVNLLNSAANCGKCGMACAEGQRCLNGRCEKAPATASKRIKCESFETQCGEKCINLKVDSLNCGACGTACPRGATCINGKCEKGKASHSKRDEIVLAHPWQPFGGSYEVPLVTVVNNICFARGLVRGFGGLVGQLPEHCRPSQGRLIFTLEKGNQASRVDVLADGRIYHIVAGGGQWLSLNQLTFAVRNGPSFPLVNNWVSWGDSYRPHSLTQSAGVCLLSGIIRGGQWGDFGRVTQSCRPDSRLVFSANNHEGLVRVDILQNGIVSRAGGTSRHGWVAFDGIVYGRNPGLYLKLENDWSNYGEGYRGASILKSGKVCVLSGLIKNVRPWRGHITILPKACRPSRRLVFGVNVHMRNARVDVLPDGRVFYITNRERWNWLSLSGIAFTVSTAKLS